MGLSGFVYCRCWKDAGLSGPIGFDEDGWLDLLTPEDPVARQWFQAGCEHEDFQVAWVDLGSLSGQRAVRQTCEAIGWSLLPTLREALPRRNDGWIPAPDVPAVLSELDLFESQLSTVTETVLLDKTTGQAIYGCIGSHPSTFGWAGTLHARIDPEGFFILDTTAEPPALVFRAKRFTPRVPREAIHPTRPERSTRMSSIHARTHEATHKKIVPGSFALTEATPTAHVVSADFGPHPKPRR